MISRCSLFELFLLTTKVECLATCFDSAHCG